jgi:hypothetical protein
MIYFGKSFFSFRIRLIEVRLAAKEDARGDGDG